MQGGALLFNGFAVILITGNQDAYLELKMCDCAKDSKYWDQFEDVMKDYTGDKSLFIPLLQKLQDAYGYLPRDVIERLSGKAVAADGATDAKTAAPLCRRSLALGRSSRISLAF